MKILLYLFPFLPLFFSSCLSYKTVKSTSTVPAGTEVSYAKVINSAYAKEYIGADIITEVHFYTPGASNAWQAKIPKKHIAFQVIPIGSSAKDAPFGGGALGDYVFIPKSQGDLIFSLQQGDRIQLRGGTGIRKSYIGGATLIEFVATSVTKL